MQIERIQSNLNAGYGGENVNAASQTGFSGVKSTDRQAEELQKIAQPTVNEKIEETQQQHELTVEELQEQVNKLNDVASIVGSKVTFKIHQETGRVLARVVSLDTGEVIREVPSERVVEMMAKMLETFGVGIMLDEEG